MSISNNYFETEEDKRDLFEGLEFVPRTDWTNVPKSPWLTRFTGSPKYVFFGLTRKTYTTKASPGAQPDQYVIFRELEYILKGDMHRTGKDIRYNFILGTDGRIYEGRGWKHAPKLPVKYYKKNLDSLYITFIGDFSGEKPSEDLFRLRERFIQYGVMTRQIKKKFSLVTLPDPYGYYMEPFYHYNYEP